MVPIQSEIFQLQNCHLVQDYQGVNFVDNSKNSHRSHCTLILNNYQLWRVLLEATLPSSGRSTLEADLVRKVNFDSGVQIGELLLGLLA